MKRTIIKIDEELCNGCGACIPNCHEGALQIIDGKARLVSDLFCDGLGACIGHCPEGAIALEEREAEPYDEVKVMETIVKQGRNTILAHLEHLRDHNEQEYLDQAIRYIHDHGVDMAPVPGLMADESHDMPHAHAHGCGCQGSAEMDFREDIAPATATAAAPAALLRSELKQWPVQLHLLNPAASYFRNADVLLAADCVAFSMGNFHPDYLKGKSLAIACPKLDSNKESYLEKITAMIRDTKINTLTVMMMEVPCCGGLLQLAQMARQRAGRNIPVKSLIVGIQGEVLREEWV